MIDASFASKLPKKASGGRKGRSVAQTQVEVTPNPLNATVTSARPPQPDISGAIPATSSTHVVSSADTGHTDQDDIVMEPLHREDGVLSPDRRITRSSTKITSDAPPRSTSVAGNGLVSTKGKRKGKGIGQKKKEAQRTRKGRGGDAPAESSSHQDLLTSSDKETGTSVVDSMDLTEFDELDSSDSESDLDSAFDIPVGGTKRSHPDMYDSDTEPDRSKALKLEDGSRLRVFETIDLTVEKVRHVTFWIHSMATQPDAGTFSALCLRSI